MITAIIGPNAFAAHRSLHEHIEKFKADKAGGEIKRLEGEALAAEQLSEALSGISLFGGDSMVVISRLDSHKDKHSQVIEVLKNAPHGQQVLVYEPQIDKRSKYFAFLKENARIKEHAQLDEASLAVWLVELARKSGGEISRPTASKLIERIGTDQWSLYTEIEKLINYQSKIDEAAVENLVEETPRESIFKLLDAVMERRSKAAAELYADMLAQRMEPSYIISMLAWQLYNMVLVKRAKDTSQAELAKEAKISPFVIRKTQAQVRGRSLGELLKMVELAAETDLKLKNVSIDNELAVGQLVSRLAA